MQKYSHNESLEFGWWVCLKVAYGKMGVAADHPIAVKIGLDVLESGGNAFDAAIAVSAALSVLQPQSGGLGGDAFMLFLREGEVKAYASNGRSFSGFDPERFIEEKPKRGPLTATVPGLAALWEKVSEELTSFPLGDLLQPSISLAQNGFYASYMLSSASISAEKELSRYRWTQYYRGIMPGDIVRNAEMARTLKIISQRGPRDFYEGKLAEEVLEQLRQQGVEAEEEDLKKHHAEEVRTLKLEVEGKELYEFPPSTHGATTLHLISALHELGLDRMQFADPNRIDEWREPIRIAYEFRDNFIGDPEFMNVDLGKMLRYSDIRGLSAGSSRGGGGSDTTFFIVSDGENLVGFIQSLFNPFGSGLIIGGFPLQNRGLGFATRKGIPNSPAPRKRPLHTLSILGINEEKAKRIIGCVGGDVRPQLHLRAYENIYVYNMKDHAALISPRFIFTSYTGEQVVEVEEPLPMPESRKYRALRVPLYGTHGYLHLAKIDERGVLSLASDPRTEGIAVAL
jgi:gamma-glutamyltranspeptidase/glutathione hydrolase